MIQELTARQKDVLKEISRLEIKNETITTRLLADIMNIPRQNIRIYVKALQDLGYAQYHAAERHTAIIRITNEGWAYLGQPNPHIRLSLPILREVLVGVPDHVEEHIEGYVTHIQDVLDVRDGDFLLRVHSDSMIGIGIYPGDYVVIHPTNMEPVNGEVALVAVPGDSTATLKRWQRHNGTVTLHSESPAYASMTYHTSDVIVQGYLLGHIGSGRTRIRK
ncbi:hypothetical protein K7W42_16730 [Deinococcus sp. HMF7604]|uniref:LexA family protein n=1 Tax=Deinococcus betulae TaxID=2873312 RepID=UPI001CCD6EE8|nr:S24 family peptidase [Deinococcus betulae]MBZ9752495.1 hypothetical protein [Deinococcus betulae]